MSERKSEFSATQMCTYMYVCICMQLGSGLEVQWLSDWQDIILFTADTLVAARRFNYALNFLAKNFLKLSVLQLKYIQSG